MDRVIAPGRSYPLGEGARVLRSPKMSPSALPAVAGTSSIGNERERAVERVVVPVRRQMRHRQPTGVSFSSG